MVQVSLELHKINVKTKLVQSDNVALFVYSWTRDSNNWIYKNETEEPILCGNVTGSRHCPRTHTCLCVGENPNHGYTSFDNFLWSMLTTFQLITLDYWENVYNMVCNCYRNCFIKLYYKVNALMLFI